MGYSGSGKSTLAQFLSEKYNLDVLHLDTVQFLPNWEIRSQEDKESIVLEFLDSHNSWIIEGNYPSLHLQRRLQEADSIIIIQFNRFLALYRVIKRYLKYKGTSRPDISIGCNEKIDFEFVKWILYNGRTKKYINFFQKIFLENIKKTKILKNQKDIDNFKKLIT